MAPQSKCVGKVISIANSNALFVNYPELTGGALMYSKAQPGKYQIENGIEGLVRGSQHPDPAMTAGAILTNVSEIKIERHEDAILSAAGCK